MDFITHEELLDKHYGEVGTKKRDNFDKRIKLISANEDKVHNAIQLLKEVDLKLLYQFDSCTQEQYKAIKTLRRIKYTKIEEDE